MTPTTLMHGDEGPLVTRYQHEANKTNGRPCGDDSREPCGWCLLEHVERLQRAIVNQDAVMAKRFEVQSKLLDGLNVRLRAIEPATIAEVERERAELRDKLSKLTYGVVANAGRIASVAMPRWAFVRDAAGVGSTRARDMCLAANFDPDETIEPEAEEEHEPDESEVATW